MLPLPYSGINAGGLCHLMRNLKTLCAVLLVVNYEETWNQQHVVTIELKAESLVIKCKDIGNK